MHNGTCEKLKCLSCCYYSRSRFCVSWFCGWEKNPMSVACSEIMSVRKDHFPSWRCARKVVKAGISEAGVPKLPPKPYQAQSAAGQAGLAPKTKQNKILWDGVRDVCIPNCKVNVKVNGKTLIPEPMFQGSIPENWWWFTGWIFLKIS